MSGPGWYPDPQDAASLRWFDGDDWTEYRQHVEAPPEPARSAATAPVAVGGVAAGGGYGSYPAGAAPSDAYDPYSARGNYAASNAPPDLAAESTQVMPESAAAVQLAAANRANHAAGGRAKLDRRLVLIVVAVVAIVAALVVGGLLLFSGGSDNSFTYQGKSIANAGKTLQTAESEMAKLVTSRNGASNSSTRCYYAVPTNPAGAKKTDIAPALRCGPVLFVDGDSSATYLSYGFTATGSGGSVTLSPNLNPVSTNPGAAPTDLVLKRPDGKKPPAGAGGLTAPAPPAAAADALVASTVKPPAGAKSVVAIVGSFNGGITITDIGKVDRYGQGVDARSAPANHQLYAFTLAGAAGNSGVVKDLSSATTISVDSGEARPVPSEKSGQSVVIDVPNTAKSVVLTLTDGALKQTFSLLDAKPGAGNVQVLARKNRSLSANQSKTATYNYSTKVVFADHVTGTTQTATLALAGVTLAYRDDVNNFTASAPDKALLIPDLVYTGSHDGGPYGIDTSLLTFTPTDASGTKGAAITAKNISTDPAKIRNVFEVPADVTTGVISVGGTATETFSGSTGTYTLTVAVAMDFPISFPAG
jgi:hypothetical protein